MVENVGLINLLFDGSAPVAVGLCNLAPVVNGVLAWGVSFLAAA